VSQIPDDYPFTGLLDMRQITMSALFEFGVRCALQQGLWGSAAHALAGVSQSSARKLARVSTDCPSSSTSTTGAAETSAAGDLRTPGAAMAAASVGLGVISHP
jgi:hypothetical protein